MFKRPLLHIALSSAIALSAFSALSAQAQTVDANAVVQQYANLVYANYSDTLSSAKAMQKAIDDALASEVPAAIVVRRPCLLIKRIKHDVAGA